MIRRLEGLWAREPHQVCYYRQPSRSPLRNSDEPENAQRSKGRVYFSEQFFCAKLILGTICLEDNRIQVVGAVRSRDIVPEWIIALDLFNSRVALCQYKAFHREFGRDVTDSFARSNAECATRIYQGEFGCRDFLLKTSPLARNCPRSCHCKHPV